MRTLEKYFPDIFLTENRKPAIILLMAPVLMTTWKYYGTKNFFLAHLGDKFDVFNRTAMTAEWYTYLSALVLFGLSSFLVIRFIFKEPLKNYGIFLGDWKKWMVPTAILGGVMIFLSFISSKNPQFIAEYPLYKGAGDTVWLFAVHAFVYLIFYINWEFFFRGFMQFGLAQRFGVWGAILVQTALSCIIHIGKPDSEIYSSILGALVWGFMVYRYKSIMPSIITHWLLGISLDFFICFT